MIVVILIILLCLDSLYLFVFKNVLLQNIQKVQKDKKVTLNYVAAFIVYIILAFGLYYFIIRQKKSIKDAFLFGICVYGIYEFTNLAIFKDWQLNVVLIDTLWGGILASATTYLARLIYK